MEIPSYNNNNNIFMSIKLIWKQLIVKDLTLFKYLQEKESKENFS